MTDSVDAVRALLHRCRLVVLDFDGPLARLLPGEKFLRVAAGARELAVSLGVVLDDELARQTDHVQLLRLVSRRDAATARAVERWCTERELEAAAAARPVAAAGAFVRACHERGTGVAVVTNNAAGAVTAVLAHGGPPLTALPVHGRTPDALERLKPSPSMLLAAAREAGTGPGEAVMVGDSASDVHAATAAAMPCIGLSPDPARRAELLAAGAAVAVPDLASLLPER
ncbi:haloacid dehalogenase superfamily, subfamily IA, variant 3 with third motif having DD or ED [Georgenia satyanarayanai]|uniref:Haloacid dehalogenase superfamily, subfamily IA, variant 3 with third motif having DD or ED n=1 Tax=Georgenia satyanarayanai TaxID=860221 RepID=A0A2Y9A790_9MICO|nr:HAD family hydrolase [Georgenia satyanarayanai]PYG00133.1 HAD superfamily hydrolase (TIGR01509 family) [Georgenia satyanarayanai]SSA40210.1 haloacid dehalogenase superfamily, subfamily IA, variant 3 with third motif having DD or ED [Georgenia satyanarayanai]